VLDSTKWGAFFVSLCQSRACLKAESAFGANSMCGICHTISLSGKCQIETELSQFQKKIHVCTCIYFWLGNLILESQFHIVTERAEHTSVTLIDKKSLSFCLAGVAKCGIRAERTLR
jgi:hypothetical protein